MSPDSCHPAERHGAAMRVARGAGTAVLLAVLYLCIGGPAVSPLAASPLAEAAPPRPADAGIAPGPAEPAPAHNAAPSPDAAEIAAVTVQLRAALDNVATELNRRPRKRHGYLTPSEVLATLLSKPTNQTGVAKTT